jgi:hypothetical protein
MAARDLILHALGSATLIYLPVLVEVLEAPEQPTYELADEVHAQTWLLQSLERRLADYAIARGSTPLLLNALGAVGDLVDRLADLHTQLVAIDQPGILSGTQVRAGADPAEADGAAAQLSELLADEIEARETRRDGC